MDIIRQVDIDTVKNCHAVTIRDRAGYWQYRADREVTLAAVSSASAAVVHRRKAEVYTARAAFYRGSLPWETRRIECRNKLAIATR